MLETVGMGISGTCLAIVLSIPLGALAARNVNRNKFIYNLVKEVTNFFRAMPELVFALIFVVAVGLGPFAGVLALGLHTAGFLGKFYAEAMENVDPNPVEAVEATGARFLQRLSHSIFPQVLPLFNSYNLFILDRNIRASTIMGLVGAGGIGFELVMTSRMFEYRQMAAMLLVILATIMAVDWLSAYLRKQVV
jgi:phosphonate transport system permease protein